MKNRVEQHSRLHFRKRLLHKISHRREGLNQVQRFWRSIKLIMLVHLVNTQSPCCVLDQVFYSGDLLFKLYLKCLVNSGEELDSSSSSRFVTPQNNKTSFPIISLNFETLCEKMCDNIRVFEAAPHMNMMKTYPLPGSLRGKNQTTVLPLIQLPLFLPLFPPQLSLIWNQRSSFVLQETNKILSNWARQKHNVQSLAALCFPKAHEKRGRGPFTKWFTTPFPFLWITYLVV